MSIKKVNAALVSGYKAMNLGLPTYYETRDRPIGPVHAEGHQASVVNVISSRRAVTLGEGGEDEILGYFQIDFRVPENTGTADLHNYADLVQLYFIAGMVLTYEGQAVRITSATPSSIRKANGMSVISLTINWYARVVRGQLPEGQTSIPPANDADFALLYQIAKL